MTCDQGCDWSGRLPPASFRRYEALFAKDMRRRRGITFDRLIGDAAVFAREQMDREVAFHEAGHCAIAACRGWRIEAASIDSDGTHDAWVRFEKANREGYVTAAPEVDLAGMAAALKHH